jgi:hypothetical protein
VYSLLPMTSDVKNIISKQDSSQIGGGINDGSKSNVVMKQVSQPVGGIGCKEGSPLWNEDDIKKYMDELSSTVDQEDFSPFLLTLAQACTKYKLNLDYLLNTGIGEPFCDTQVN